MRRRMTSGSSRSGRSKRRSGRSRMANRSRLRAAIRPSKFGRRREPISPAEACVSGDVCFSNRPVGVKRFQIVHDSGVGIARGLVLLYGIGTKALPPWDPRTRWSNLMGGLADRPSAGPSGHANSPHPSSREEHHLRRAAIAGCRRERTYESEGRPKPSLFCWTSNADTVLRSVGSPRSASTCHLPPWATCRPFRPGWRRSSPIRAALIVAARAASS